MVAASALSRPAGPPRARAAGALLLLALAAGCEHPIPVVTPHLEAAEAVVRDSSGAELARTRDNREWIGAPLLATDGVPRRLVVTFVDFQGREITLADRRDVDVRMEAEDERLASWEPLTGAGLLRTFGAGTTRVRFLAWHQTHADFVTPWITLTITPAAP